MFSLYKKQQLNRYFAYLFLQPNKEEQYILVFNQKNSLHLHSMCNRYPNFLSHKEDIIKNKNKRKNEKARARALRQAEGQDVAMNASVNSIFSTHKGSNCY